MGWPLKRKEDPRLIQGIGHYVDDISLPGMLHAVFVRSPYAHARVRSVETSKAKVAPGVVTVMTGADLGTAIGMVPCAAQIPDMKSAPRPVLATDRVRFIGEAVAVVVAEDRYAARDAADLVEVDYEPLTPVVDPEKAIAKGAPVLFDQYKDNVAFRWELEGGDVKKAFEQADVVVRQRIVNQRVIPMAMETRGVIAEYKPGEKTLTDLVLDTDSTPSANAARGHVGHTGTIRARNYSRSGRWIWQQAERISGRSPGRLPFHEA